MRVGLFKNKKRITLDPGEYHATKEPLILSTLLGSCVSACLYEPQSGIIGMNHFLLSNRRYAKDMPLCITEAGRYGVHSMELLINTMIKLGAKRSNLHAKAFGGASILVRTNENSNFLCVGEVNVRFIKEFLLNEGIKLVSSDLGGSLGRVIHFFPNDYSVYMKKIQKTTKELYERDKKLWKTSINQRETENQDNNVDLW